MLHRFIVLRKSPIEGKGLFARELIKKGEIIWKGPTAEKSYRLSEIKKWPQKKQDTFDFYAYQTGKDTYTGPLNGKPKDPSLYMNHSCDPNSWFSGDNLLLARRDIKRGQEVTYDYETSDTDTGWSMQCRCGSQHCRKILDGRAYLKKTFQKTYKNHVLSHIRARFLP